MSTAKSAIKNTGLLYAKMCITIFISLYTTRLVLNTLGAADFGIYNIVGGAIAMLGFLNASMASATQRFMSYSVGENDKEKQRRIFNISFVMHFIIALAIAFVLIAAGYFFFNGILNIQPQRIFAAKVVYGSLILSTVFTIMTVPYDAVINARENMLYYAIVGIIESLLKLAAAITLLYSTGDKLVIYGILTAAIPLAVMTFMRIYCHLKYQECVIAPQKYWDQKLMKEMRRFAGWNLFASTGSMIGYYGQGIVLNMFFGTIINAAQGIANQLNGQIIAFVTNMQKAINPIIVKREGKGDRKSMLDISLIGTRLSFFILLYLSIPVVTYMDLLLGWWLGDGVSDEMVLFTRLLLTRSLIEQISLTISTSISATGNIKRIKTIASVLSISSLFLSYMLFKYGFDSSALYYVFITNTIFQATLVLIDARTKCGLSLERFYKSVLIPCLFATSIVAAFSFGYQYTFTENLGTFIWYGISYSIIFMFVICIIGISGSERNLVKGVIKNKLLTLSNGN